jgi:hypothetical protein
VRISASRPDGGRVVGRNVAGRRRSEAGLVAGDAVDEPEQIPALELYHRSRNNRDAIGAEFFSVALTPAGFQTEINAPVHRVETQRAGAGERWLRAAARSRLGGPALYSGTPESKARVRMLSIT